MLVSIIIPLELESIPLDILKAVGWRSNVNLL
jgi:hypothetical protein